VKLCHVVSHVDEEASGPSYSVPRLCEAIAARGHDVILATLDRGRPHRQFNEITHQRFRQSRLLSPFGDSLSMRRWMSDLAGHQIEILHSHGLWMMPNVYPAFAAARNRIPYVAAPRGTLDPAALAYSPGRKWAVWRLIQRRALRLAKAMHATSMIEVDHIRAAGLTQPIALLPNGIDIPPIGETPPSARHTLLYLGRLHPKKGLDLLLEAWGALEVAHPNWDLRIVGKGSPSYIALLSRMMSTLRLQRVSLEPPLYGDAKTAALAQANLFILPTRGENFGMVVAEALAAGTPVVTTRGAPWKDVERRGCGWWASIDAAGLRRALASALSEPPEMLRQRGLRGRAWMVEEFHWDVIGERTLVFYEWLLKGGRPPAFVVA